MNYLIQTLSRGRIAALIWAIAVMVASVGGGAAILLADGRSPMSSALPVTSASPTDDRLFPIPGNADSSYRWGYINQMGTTVISPRFDRAQAFSDELAIVSNHHTYTDQNNVVHAAGYKFGFIDRAGKVVIPLQFDDAKPFSEGLAAVQVGQRWGYIDKTGKLVIPAQYEAPEEFVGNFSEGRVPIWMESKSRWGYLDNTGKLVIPAQFEAAGSFSEGLAVVQQGGKLGFIDRAGKFVVPPQFESMGTFPPSFSEGLLPVQVDAQARVEQGRVVMGGSWGYADKTGKLVIPPQFQSAYAFSEGLAPVLVSGRRDLNMIQGGKWGYINRAGQFVISPQFDGASSFAEGRAVVHKAVLLRGVRCGYIDKSGKFVVRPQFPVFSCRPFSGGLAAIVRPIYGGTAIEAYLDSTGRYVWRGETPRN